MMWSVIIWSQGNVLSHIWILGCIYTVNKKRLVWVNLIWNFLTAELEILRLCSLYFPPPLWYRDTRMSVLAVLLVSLGSKAVSKDLCFTPNPVVPNLWGPWVRWVAKLRSSSWILQGLHLWVQSCTLNRPRVPRSGHAPAWTHMLAPPHILAQPSMSLSSQALVQSDAQSHIVQSVGLPTSAEIWQ